MSRDKDALLKKRVHSEPGHRSNEQDEFMLSLDKDPLLKRRAHSEPGHRSNDQEEAQTIFGPEIGCL